MTTGWLEDESRELGTDDIPELDLSNFSGKNNNAKKGRRNALSNRATEAANLVAQDDIQGAIDELTSLLQKIDGKPAPPDRMEESEERTALFNEVSLLIALLQFEP